MKAILAKRDSPSKTRCYPHGRALRGRGAWQEDWLQRGAKEMREGAGRREYWRSGQPRVCDCWAFSGRAQYGSWKKLMRETIWYQPGLCAK